MARELDISVSSPDGSIDQRLVRVDRLYNLGSATRDPRAAEAHQDEVAKEGVRIAFDIPAPRIYPIAPSALLTSDEVWVHGEFTSGEVEVVALRTPEELLIGVASDHTDRQLERVSILWSKQACPDVVAPTFWRWEDVEPHWDACRLTCEVDGSPYQDVGVDAFLTPPEIMEIVDRRAAPPAGTIVVLCGTWVSLSSTLTTGRTWTFGLHDPVLDRRIGHQYRVANILDEIPADYRVPLVVDAG